MKTVLVVAEHPELAHALPQALHADAYRVLHRATVEDAEPLLGGGVIDVCIVDIAPGNIQGMWTIEKLRRRMPSVPVIVYVGGKPWEFEEEAYVQGVAYVVTKPVRPRMLNVLLDRLWKPAGASSAAMTVAPRAVPPTVIRAPMIEPVRAPAAPSPAQTLTALRDFSAILTHSLSAEGLLKQFLLLLREIIGVNRAAIFLRSPVAGLGDAPRAESRRLSCACAIGLSSNVLEHFQLSFESGIASRLLHSGRILRRYFDESATDPEVEKEFELLGAQVAVPILDRETLIGVAAFDGRVTGEPLGNNELELLFHLLEELGLAVKNIWQHDQLAENHGMLTNILRELSSACVLVSRDLTILHANKTARSYFGRAGRSSELAFSDLPMVLGSKVFQVLKTGTAIATFRHQPPDQPNVVYQVTIMPFQVQSSGLPNSVLLLVEDQTQSEHLKHLEIEAANLRLVRTMADRLAHEVGNALVPLSTHQQLLGDKFRDPEFRASLDHALADGVKRISRLINQMRFLAREGTVSRETLPLNDLITEAFQDAQKHQPARSSKLKQEAAEQPIILAGDHAALRHAFSEVFLNALQANPSDPKIAVKSLMDTDVAGSRWVHIDVEDNGAGFTPEALKKVPEPFFTTRNVGLGLGLTVSRKIIETHHGKLAILPAEGGHSVVRISLPLGQK